LTRGLIASRSGARQESNSAEIPILTVTQATFSYNDRLQIAVNKHLLLFAGFLCLISLLILNHDFVYVSFSHITIRNVTRPEEVLVPANYKNSSIHDVIGEKRKSLQAKAAEGEDCFCPHGRSNWIHYTSCGGAGIKDRQNILRNMMWYADELCAKIALECTPDNWLSKANHGCYAPKNATWDLYFTPVRMNAALFPIEVKTDLIHLVKNLNTSVFHGLRTIHNASAAEGYNEGRNLHSKGIPFVWEFDKPFWKTDLYTKGLPLRKKISQSINHRPYNETCGKLDFDTSTELLNVGELMLEQLNITNSRDFITLHLRRGDYMKCPTDTATVLNYVNCSMANDDVKKIVVLTNGEEEYTKNLTEAFTSTFPTKEMIVLDQFIMSKSFIEKLNESKLLSVHSEDDFLNDNCFRFSAEKVLVPLARYHLERGHTHCSNCDRGGLVMTGKPII
jgi:hypothetical protein